MLISSSWWQIGVLPHYDTIEYLNNVYFLASSINRKIPKVIENKGHNAEMILKTAMKLIENRIRWKYAKSMEKVQIKKKSFQKGRKNQNLTPSVYKNTKISLISSSWWYFGVLPHYDKKKYLNKVYFLAFSINWNSLKVIKSKGHNAETIHKTGKNVMKNRIRWKCAKSMEKVQIKKSRPEKEDKISILSPPFTRIKESV